MHGLHSTQRFCSCWVECRSCLGFTKCLGDYELDQSTRVGVLRRGFGLDDLHRLVP